MPRKQVSSSRTEVIQLLDLSDLLVSEAAHEVIVDHADGLHERIAYRRADEFEPAAKQVFAHGLRLAR